MYLTIEKGIRGGISQAFKRYSKANNKYFKGFDPSKPESYLLLVYVDANNLYGWALSKKLPYEGIMWTDLNNITLEEWKEVLELNEDEDCGYTIDCDLEYPKELHNEHTDFPLAPEYYNKRLLYLL